MGLAAIRGNYYTRKGWLMTDCATRNGFKQWGIVMNDELEYDTLMREVAALNRKRNDLRVRAADMDRKSQELVARLRELYDRLHSLHSNKADLLVVDKPNWRDAPSWARWLAQDESGVWSWFEHEPEPIYSGMMWDSSRGSIAVAHRVTKGFDETLEARPT